MSGMSNVNQTIMKPDLAHGFAAYTPLASETGAWDV